MTCTIFTWDMFKFAKNSGVGHAAMHVHGDAGNAYISFWPAAHRVDKAVLSTGKVHFMTGDKAEDGQPSWASAPIGNLDEKKMLGFWRGFDTSCDLDYKGSKSDNLTKPNDGGVSYNILFSQCSTTVVRALFAGADMETRMRMISWLAVNGGSTFDIGDLKGFSIPFLRIPTITPADVREMVKSIWGS